MVELIPAIISNNDLSPPCFDVYGGWAIYRKLESLQDSLSEANNNTEKLQELLDRVNEEHKTELSTLNNQHEKTTAELKSLLDDLVGPVVASW